MKIFGKLGKTTVITSAAAIAVLAGSTAAFAASSYNVAAGSASSGTSFNWTATTTGASPQVQFVDTTSLAAFTCTSAVAHGTATVGTVLSNPLGQIATTAAGTGTIWNGCKDTATSSALTVTGTYPWSLNGNGDTVSGVTPGTIGNINAHVHANNGLCDFDVKDQSGTAGHVDVKWTNGSPSTLEVLNNPTLAVKNVSGFGCALLGVANNDTAKFHAIYNVNADVAANNPVTLTSNP